MDKNNQKQSLLKNFSFAFQGLRAAYQEEYSFRIELFIALLVVILSVILRISSLEWMLVIIAMAMVLSLELLNSRIERMMNILHPEVHDQVKVIKDISAAAVLIASLMALIIGLIIFIPYLF